MSVGPIEKPVTKTNVSGSSVTLTGLASGSPSGWQWTRDGLSLVESETTCGTKTPTLTMTSVSGRDAGSYSLILSNSFGCSTSHVATLIVRDPILLGQPVSQQAEPGGSAAFAVTASGSEVLRYQWRRNGLLLPSATGSILNLSDLQHTDAGFYDVVVNNDYGSVTSSAALLTVNEITADALDLRVAVHHHESACVLTTPIQPDGKILVAGTFRRLAGVDRLNLGRVQDDGSLDMDFDPMPGGMMNLEYVVNALAVQPDGRTVVGGGFISLAGHNKAHIGRIHPDGSLDESFPSSAYNAVTALALQPDGWIVAGGAFTQLNGVSRNRLGRLRSDGSLDTAFNPGANDVVWSLALQPDGKILAGGRFTSIAGTQRKYLARLHPHGAIDTDFFAEANGAVTCVALQSDGGILVAGSFTQLAGTPRQRIGRLLPDGSLDDSFNPGADDDVFTLALQADGKILLGGKFTNVAGATRKNIARLLPDGAPDPTFNPGAGTVYSLAQQSDGKILVGGLPGVARLNNNDQPVESLALEDSEITWRRGGGAPEVWRTTVETSTNGISWTSRGSGTRIPGGWSFSDVAPPDNGSVRVRGYVVGGQRTASTWVVEQIHGLPAFTVQPVCRCVSGGGDVTFSAHAGGTEPITYQWRRNQAPISGATNSFLILTNVQLSDAGDYDLVVTNPIGSSTSSSARLMVLSPPVISLDPISQSVSGGSDVTLTAGVEGTAPLSYQWRFNGKSIPDVPTIHTIAGGGTLGDGVPAREARLTSPFAVAADSSGNLYIADEGAYRIRKVDPKGIITTVAADAALSRPTDIAVHPFGDLYIADFGNGLIRKVDTKGIVTTVAGGGRARSDAIATNIYLSGPTGVALDSIGNLFIAERDGNQIRKVSPSGIITTVAGNGTLGTSGDGGPALLATFAHPSRVAVDTQGNLYISDASHRVRKVSTNGIITTVAGTGVSGFSGDWGKATSALLNVPDALALDVAGNLYIAEFGNHRIRTVGRDGIIITVAGGGFYLGDGISATDTSLVRPQGVALDACGNLLIADTGRGRIRKIGNSTGPTLVLTNLTALQQGRYSLVVSNAYGTVTSAVAMVTVAPQPPEFSVSPASQTVFAGSTVSLRAAATGKGVLNYQWRLNGTNLAVITTLAGNGTPGFGGDSSPAFEANLNSPSHAISDGAGNLYIADAGNSRVRKVTLDGMIITVAGNGRAGFGPDRIAATNSSLNEPVALALDAYGSLYIADRRNGRIRKVDANGIISTVVSIGSPSGVAFDSLGRLYIATFGAILRVGLDGAIATVAAGDVVSWLRNTSGLVFDSNDNLYFAAETRTGSKVLRLSTFGSMDTFAGGGALGDGSLARLARLASASGVGMNALGEVFIADTGHFRIRKVDLKGVINTVAGDGRPGFAGDDGPASIASLNHPQAVFADSGGDLLVADSRNHRIRRVGRSSRCTLILNEVTQASQGGYSVVASSPYGSVTSAVASLTIDLPFTIIEQPVSQSVIMGEAATLRVKVAGVGPFRYQWRRSGIIITNDTVITTVAGSGTQGFSGDSGLAIEAALDTPEGLVSDAGGNIFIADTSNRRIRRVDPSGIITTLVGRGKEPPAPDNTTATNTLLASIVDVAVDALDRLYIADRPGNRIWMLDSDGALRPIAGSGMSGFSGDGGIATDARLLEPAAVALDVWGNLYIADSQNRRIRRVGEDGGISTVAGGGTIPWPYFEGFSATNAMISPDFSPFPVLQRCCLA